MLRMLGVMVLSITATLADEGMWLFNDPPLDILEKKYNFHATPQWLEHLQKASVRFNNGGSGSLVSPDGLTITNHHVASDTLQKLSTEGKDYLTTGFYARTREEEIKAHDLELNVLMDIEDVTARVNAAVKQGMDSAAAEKARRAVMNTIEKESFDKTGLRSDVITLYNGGLYHLYRYKKYTDVRLVFAPEKDIAFLGGDPDNFEFPRYNLDIALFRVYENGKPAKIQHYLKWSAAGPKDGDLIFVSGNPGKTERLDTVAHLEFLRDRVNPLSLNVIRRREVLLKSYSERSVENARRARDDLDAYQNSRKARLGMLAGLQEPSLMGKKRAEEKALQQAMSKDAKLMQVYGDAWDQVARAIKTWGQIYDEHYLLERGNAFESELFQIARHLVRLVEETAKPNPERLREYSDAALESLRLELFSEAPIYDDLEIAKLADSLSMLVEMRGADDKLVGEALAGKAPQERAVELVQRSRLKDVAVRKKLEEGGRKALEASQDPIIRLAHLVDPPARQVRRVYQEQVEEPLRQAYAKIAQARFAAYGRNIYPDATFTLRLAFGEVKGYTDKGERIPWTTTFGGAYQHSQNHAFQEPFALPKSWLDHKSNLSLDTPFNFVNTADIVGGNSGSPVVNRQGEFSGIIFDGNIYSLVLDFLYTEEQARAVAVHSAAILEALRRVYGTDALVRELTR